MVFAMLIAAKKFNVTLLITVALILHVTDGLGGDKGMESDETGMAGAGKVADFWSWFQANEASFPATAEFDAAYGRELSARLSEYKPGIVYEIAIPDDRQKELVISADGIKELIPFVQNLVDAAPAMNAWTIHAFRPRMDNYADFELDFDEHSFKPKTLWCWSRIEDGHFDLIIYHPNYTDELRDLLVNGTYILLDTALGEYDVMTGVRYIDHQKLPEDPESAGLYRFENLRVVFDEYKSSVTH